MQKINNLLKHFSTLLVILVVILAILLAGVRILGLDVYVVLSGSMEPEYPVGGIVYVSDPDFAEIGEGDVITFQLSEDVVATHRIIEVVPDENNPSVVRYRTKGDANEAEDGALVEQSNVIGTPVFKLPYLGYLAMFIQTSKGKYLAIAGCAALLLIVVLTELITGGVEETSEKKEKKEKKKKKETLKEDDGNENQ